MLTKKSTVVLIALCLGIVGLFSFISVRDRLTKTAQITVEVAPGDTTITTANGKRIKKGINRFAPGKIVIRASRAGFENQEQSFELKKGDQEYAGFILVPNSSYTANWYQTHPEDQKTAEGISSKLFDVSSEKQIQTAPLISYLPFIGAGDSFRIDYGPTDKNGKPIIYISAEGEDYYKAAIEWIKYKGFDPASYTIEKILEAP